MYTISSQQDVYPANALGNPSSTIHQWHHGLHWAPITLSKGHRHALTFISLLTSYLITVPLKTKTADKVSMGMTSRRVYPRHCVPTLYCRTISKALSGIENLKCIGWVYIVLQESSHMAANWSGMIHSL